LYGKPLKKISIIFGLCLFTVQLAFTQPTLHPRNLALGGGGAAYLTGPQAAFYNPANLIIQDRSRRFQISIGNTAMLFNPVQYGDNNSGQVTEFRNHFIPYNSLNPIQDANARDDLLDQQFGSSRTLSENIARFELNWFGLNWKNENYSFGISARSRAANRFQAGRNFFDTQPFERDNERYYRQNLRQQFQVLHEISFGYAESIELLNGLTPALDQFSIGIAPKFIIAGPFFDASFRSLSNISPQNQISRTQSYTQYSSGAFSAQTESVLSGASAANATSMAFDGSWFNEVTGFGGGIDIGLTYLVTFGSDLSTLEGSEQFTNRSLRISFSLTDVGLIRYTENSSEIRQQENTQDISALNPVSDEYFDGRPGSYFAFLEANNSLNFPATLSENDDRAFSRILPTSLHTGMLLEINRLKLMGDFSIGLTNNAFSNNKLLTHIGVELRALPFLPLRAGTRLAINTPTLLTFGTGIETRYFDLSVAAAFNEDRIADGLLTGAGMASLSFNF
jgi:hypothetical protein